MALLDSRRSPASDHALAFVRIVAGVIFISVGTMKVFGFPASPMPVALWSQMGIGGLIEVVGGILIGVIESMAGFYLPQGWKDVAPYIVLLAVLLLKPEGIFGLHTRKKV